MNKEKKKQEKESTGMGITSFVLSLLGFFGWIAPYFSIWLSIVAIVFAGLQKKKKSTGLATSGLVIGILGVLSNLFWLFIVTLLVTLGGI